MKENQRMNLLKHLRKLLQVVEADIIASSGRFSDRESRMPSLINELRSLKRFVSSTQEESFKEFRLAYGDKAYVLDYIIFLHTNLFLICMEKFYPREDTDSEPEEVAQKMCYVTLLLAHLVNSLLSIRLLLSSGYDIQAKQIFRTYIEHSDIAVATMGSDEFYQNYRRMGDGEKEQREVWHKFLRPGALSKILARIYNDIDDSSELWSLVQSIRQPIYARLSDYTHGHYMAVFVGAIDEKVGGGCGPVALGAITKGMDYTLKHAIVYSFSFLKYSMIAMVKYQKLSFIKFGQEGENFVIDYKVLELFMPTFLQSWADMKKSTDA